MELTGAGTAIMLAIAAGLWFLYLAPTWVRRREYLATERTATRLQQTMRVLAETAEVPDTVRVAATARDAARAERLLRAQQRRADAMVARQVRAERAATPASMPRLGLFPLATADALRRQRLRRTRRMASLLMVGATVLGLAQIGLIATTGAALGRGPCSARRSRSAAWRSRCSGASMHARCRAPPRPSARGRAGCCRASCRCAARSTPPRGPRCPSRSPCTSRSRRCSA